MKIALFGATGMIGSRILQEALRRGHEILAIVRHPETVTATPGVRSIRGDATDAASVAATAAGAEVAVNAYSPQSGPQDDLSRNAHALIEGLPQAGVPRVIIVGGAGSLEVAPGSAATSCWSTMRARAKSPLRTMRSRFSTRSKSRAHPNTRITVGY